MAFYRLEQADASAPIDGMCAVTAGRADIVETISDEEGRRRLTFDAHGFAPDGWIWHPGSVK